MTERRYRLQVTYDGTHYAGWQVQPNGTAIQAVLQRALSLLTREETGVTGSGRTDAGVHALGQIAHFSTSTELNRESALRSLAGLLPPDIRVLDIAPAPPDFHARYSATGKIYRYYLDTRRIPLPFNRLYSFHVHHPLDLAAMRKAVAHLVGEHDFTSFANSAREGSAARDPVRTLHRITIEQKEGDVTLEFEGNGFLYRMVRNLTGTLLAVGSGKIEADEVPILLEARDRRLAPQGAAAHGLFLVEVQYPHEALHV